VLAPLPWELAAEKTFPVLSPAPDARVCVFVGVCVCVAIFEFTFVCVRGKESVFVHTCVPFDVKNLQNGF